MSAQELYEAGYEQATKNAQEKIDALVAALRTSIRSLEWAAGALQVTHKCAFIEDLDAARATLKATEAA